MKDIIEKITSYDLFNNLFPGVVFVIALEKFTNYSLAEENLVLGVFLYYFCGLVISRFGSIVIEPVLKKLKLLKFEEYRNFISASKVDSKIEQLSEINNTYRTIISLFILLLLVKLYEYLGLIFPSLQGNNVFSLILLLIVLFLFSYRKQTNYISKRIRTNLGIKN